MRPRGQSRAALRWAHRWLGLTLGLLFAVVSVSGTLLLFQPQFFDWAHGDMIPDDLPRQVGSVDRWVENARAAMPPTLHGPAFIWAPGASHNVSEAGMLVFEGLEPGGFGNMGLAGVLVAPATGDVLGVVDIDHSPAYAPIFLHRDLWSGELGRVLSGIMGLGVLLLLSVGLYLWWPSRSRLRKKLSPKPWRTALTRAPRLHDLTGAWTVIILLVVTASGIYMVQPGWTEPLLSAVSGEHAHGDPAAAASACTGPIDYDNAIARAQALAPSHEFSTMEATDGTLRRWEISLRDRDSGTLLQETHVFADLDCGTVVLESTAASRTPREALELWLVSLHDGTAFGLPGESFIALIGLAPLVLTWSGIRMWLRRRGWITSKKSRQYAASVAAHGPGAS